jgi:restriction system protein
MKQYYRIMLGKQSAHAAECLGGGFIGADFGIHQDLTRKLPAEWREFNREFIPIYQARNPGKTKIGAGLACAALWTIAKGINVGDVVLCPDGQGNYRVGEVQGDYYYSAGGVLPHRRKVRWLERQVPRASMSDALQNSSGSAGTVSNLGGHVAELERLIGDAPAAPALISTDPDVEDAAAFAMEKHLEDFLVENWESTELGREFDIWTEDGETKGQQYLTDTGPIDVLAVSKDRRRILVVELKRGRASDPVVGQILRYMGYVGEVLAEDGQEVEGAVIALEDDQKLRRALQAISHVRFYRYKVQFSLVRS